MFNLLVFLSLSLSAIYIFPSGYPQIGDLLLLVVVVSTLWQLFTGRWCLRSNGFINTWLVLVVWITCVNLVWVLIYQESSRETAGLMLVPPLYYWFNLLVGFSLLLYLQHVQQARIFIANGVAISLIICAAGVLLGMGGKGRVTAFFNNPNQLAYFALCSLSLLLIIFKGQVPIRPLPLAAIGSGIVSILAPASLGATGGLVLIVSSWAMAAGSNLRHVSRVIMAGIVLFCALLAFDYYSGRGITESLLKRFEVADDKMEELAHGGRGYDRLWAYPQYWLFGAGEGAWEQRFQPYYQGLEIHSSLGTLLFCYGSVGLILFLCLLWIVARSSPPYVSLLLVALLVYGWTHMGLRATGFWIVLAAAYAINTSPTQTRESAAHQA